MSSVEIAKKYQFSSLIVSLAIMIGASSASAAEIVIPDEELPSEAAAAQLDSPRAVLYRKVKTKERLELGLRFGWLYDETFYQNQYVGAALGYNMSEVDGFGLFMQSWAQSPSDVAKTLKKTTGALDFSRAPGPESAIGLYYQHRFMYGKFSFSQNIVLPLTLQAQLELGSIKYSSRNLPFATLGLGPDIFFSPRWALGLHARVIYRQAVNPVSISIRGADPAPTSENEFKVASRFGYDMLMGLKFLF